jgi:hypothetical protein
MSDGKNEATSILTHTLKSLGDELVSGRSIKKVDGSEIKFESEQTRSIFKWYQDNPSKWTANVAKADVEVIASQVRLKPPMVAITAPTILTNSRRILHLKSIRAHRFGGLHHYESPNKPPKEFHFEFTAPITLIEGLNGSGKTSLINAITWCLTGKIHRSQRAPEDISEGIQIKALNRDAETEFNIAAITPIPHASILKDTSDKELIIDTFVELIFTDDNGVDMPPIRRSISKTTRGKIEVKQPDLAVLNLDPIAFEIGTLMPGLIPYISFDKNSSLGEAVALLTGIQPLQDLAKHAFKVHAKLKKDLPDEKKTELNELGANYNQAKNEFVKLLEEHKGIAIGAVPAFEHSEADKELELRKSELESLQQTSLAEAKKILGEDFDVADAAIRNDLINSVGPAKGYLESGEIKSLQSILLIEELKNVTDEQILAIHKKIAFLIVQAEEIITLAQDPKIASRIRLYSKVAEWLSEESTHDFENCPVCKTSIVNKNDEITNRSISAHIEELVSADKSYLAKALASWQKSAITELNESLGIQLTTFVNKNIKERPSDLYKTALLDELLMKKAFQNSLKPIRGKFENIFSDAADKMPNIVAQKNPISLAITSNLKDFSSRIEKILKSLDFTKWVQSNDQSVQMFFNSTIGNESTDAETIYSTLENLSKIVSQSTPINESILKINRMADLIGKKMKIDSKIAEFKLAESAIQPIIGLDVVVGEVVAGLVDKLSVDTKRWKDKLYKAAFSTAPELNKTSVKGKGILELESTVQGTTVLSHHISNASDLRASLMSFLFAFWNYTIKERGGISLILFDDIQELFDDPNRSRVASTIPQIVDDIKAKIIVTTNDTKFRRTLTLFAEAKLGHQNIDIRCVHPLASLRSHIELGIFLEDIEKKKRIFEDPENENDHGPARDYVNKLRIYIEERLKDLFDNSSAGLTAKSTLGDFIGAVIKQHNAGAEPFNQTPFKRLVDDKAFKHGSDFLRVLNHSHHGEADKISYMDVISIKDDCIRAQKLVESVYEAYERWLRRDKVPVVSVVPAEPLEMERPSFAAPIIEGIAAATSYSSTRMAEVTFENFQLDWFDDKAVYRLNTHNFGFAARIGSHIIVSTQDDEVKSNSLVIALSQAKTYAGRLLKNSADPGMIVLSSEAENPKHRPPSVFLKNENTRLMKVMGIIFDSEKFYTQSSEEAIYTSNSKPLDKVEVVFTIDGDSAMPLALPKQKILAGESILPSDFHKYEGELVAVSTSEGDYFKRMGKVLPGYPRYRQLESIGALGESLVVCLEDTDSEREDLPLVNSARKIIGILYDTF